MKPNSETHPSPTQDCKLHYQSVMLESPYAGDVEENLKYARLCMRDCLLRKEAPFASHLLYTQENVLNDNVPEERVMGMLAGMSFASICSKTVVYIDRGISNGMVYGILSARKNNRKIEYRSLNTSFVLKDTKDIWFKDAVGLEMGLKEHFDKAGKNV